jgi:hypothetical protein
MNVLYFRQKRNRKTLTEETTMNDEEQIQSCAEKISFLVGENGWNTFLRALTKNLRGDITLIDLRGYIKDTLNQRERKEEIKKAIER